MKKPNSFSSTVIVSQTIAHQLLDLFHSLKEQGKLSSKAHIFSTEYDCDDEMVCTLKAGTSDELIEMNQIFFESSI